MRPGAWHGSGQVRRGPGGIDPLAGDEGPFPDGGRWRSLGASGRAFHPSLG